jgi:HSP20 family protein
MKILKRKNLGSKFSGVIEKFFGSSHSDTIGEDIYLSGMPAVNISADSKQFDISLLVPGLDKKDLKVEIEGNNLVIKCEKEFEDEKKDHNYFRKEYAYTSFQRVFEIPKGADTSKLRAKLKNGILKINMPRMKEFMDDSKKIEVK